MTEREEQLLKIIREGKDPSALMAAALDAITACLRQPGPSESPCPAAPVSAAETNP